MSRYTAVLLLLVALAVPALLAVSPALRALEEQVASLQAQTDRLPIVVDGTGEILGPERGSDTNFQTAQVQFDLPGLPIFFLKVTRNEIEVGGVALWFESTDCTGQAWVDAGVATSGITAYVRAITPVETGIRTVYVADPLATPETISRRSQNGGVCEAIVDQIDAVQATPLDLDSMFTPPFRVTTRARLEAMP